MFRSCITLLMLIWASPYCLGNEAEESKAPAVAPDFLPASVVFYIEAPNLAEVVDTILEHPLRSRLESLPAYKQVLQLDEVVQIRSVLSIFEAGMGMRWPQVVSSITDGGFYLAFDAETEGLAVLAKSRDSETLEQFRDTVTSAVRAAHNGDQDAVKEGNYRGAQVYSFDKTRIGLFDGWLLATNDKQLGKRIVDLYKDGGRTLAKKASFAEANSGRDETAVWAFADVQAIRESGELDELYSGQTENFFAELLIGGIMSNLQHANFCTAALELGTRGVELTIANPHRHEWAGENREYYFGSEGKGSSPPLLDVEDRVFALSTFRGISEMWLRAGDLMTEKGNDELAKADTQLTTFFSGRDFAEDILGSFGSEIQFVAARQNFEKILPSPAIKLPAFAIQFRMKDPQETQPELRRVFQSFIGFLNVVGAMNGQPQFDLDMQKSENTQLVTATYVPERDARDAVDAPINFNFSPTIAFADDRLIISSTIPLAKSLAERSPVSESATPQPNTVARLNAATLKEILSDNRSQLVAQNMLDKGHSHASADSEISLFLDLVGFFRGASLVLDADNEQLKLSIGVQFDE